MTKSIMIQGTGSSVGKSIIATALCRIFLQDGYKVCPFKAQNMALNSFVTKQGGEMGRAQVVQAQAAGIEPHVDMNPILLKPTTDRKAQVIVCGKPVGNMHVVKYHSYKKRAFKKVLDSFRRLKKHYDVIVIEGAGSPAEINLKKHDIVNMKIAQAAKAPVVLVGDIDKGGVFASFVGTLALLNKQERSRVKGFIINKFRGDKLLLKDGLSFLKRKTGKPVLGVVPYLKDIMIPEEDSVALENRAADYGKRLTEGKKINIAVIKLPYISNFTDFDALENEPDVKLHYISDKGGLDSCDIIIIPGTKNTIKDLIWLKENGIADRIVSATNYQPSTILIGICGGYQMLGRTIYDRGRIESRRKEIEGLGLLPIVTEFKSNKTLSQTEAIDIETGVKLKGYEIHHGRTIFLSQVNHLFKIKGARQAEGIRFKDGRICGTYLHGIFDNADFRRNFLNNSRMNLGLKPIVRKSRTFNTEKEFDKLADLVRKNIDMEALYNILNYQA